MSAKKVPHAPSEDPVTVYMDVTPAMAEKYLKHNHPDNRAIQWGRVESFSNDIRSGNFKTTHQGICFDGDGRLIDGQHRCKAIINTGITVRMSVTTDQKATIHGPLDRGQPRSMSTVTGLHSRVASACATLYRMENGIPTNTVPVTVAEVLDVYDRHKKHFNAIADNHSINKQFILGGVYAAAIWTMPIDAEKTMEFLHKVVTGEMISRGNPAYTFRAWREKTKNVQPGIMAYAALNALRYYIQEMKLGYMFVTESGYRASTSKRRAMKVPHTPSVDLVASLTWTPDGKEDK